MTFGYKLCKVENKSALNYIILFKNFIIGRKASSIYANIDFKINTPAVLQKWTDC